MMTEFRMRGVEMMTAFRMRGVEMMAVFRLRGVENDGDGQTERCPLISFGCMGDVLYIM